MRAPAKSGPPRKIVFLDFDGVVVPWDARGPDRRCVAILDELLARSGAEVVVTSCWRERLSLAALGEELAAAGFRGRLSSVTPVLPGKTRGEEISAWLEAEAPDACFVILDDCADVSPHDARLVQTNEYLGLTRAGATAALALLDVEAAPSTRRGRARPRRRRR